MKSAERERLVLAALAPARCAAFQPVQVQKLFFLIDDKLAGELGGKAFDFKPYDYGPYDKNVYTVLEHLQEQGLVSISEGHRSGDRRYNLTEEGQAKGRVALDSYGQDLAGRITTLSEWVRSLTFTQLVSAIYNEYPDMRVNSVFVQ